MNNTKKCIVLLSGGLDSAVCLGIAQKNGFSVMALTIDYGQRSSYEIKAAKQIVRSQNVKKHKILKINLSKFGGSALTTDWKIPEEETTGIPSTYVPGRNLIFLSVAVSLAEIEEAYSIFIGANVRDFSGYPDCRRDFLQNFEQTANLATRDSTNIKIKAPLLNMKKSKIISKGKQLGINLDLTSSCYNPLPDGSACGKCPSCKIREKGFREEKINEQ
ncbi:MAG: 7-cyano-7-deazaguanine synthase QueC [Elusimicrobiota bacterium]